MHYEDSHHLFTTMARGSCVVQPSIRLDTCMCVCVYVDRMDCVFVEDSCLRMVISGLLSHRINWFNLICTFRKFVDKREIEYY